MLQSYFITCELIGKMRWKLEFKHKKDLKNQNKLEQNRGLSVQVCASQKGRQWVICYLLDMQIKQRDLFWLQWPGPYCVLPWVENHTG